MHCTAAGPDGVLMAGREYDLADDEGRRLVAHRYASPVGAAARPGPSVEPGPVETAALGPAAEAAVLPATRARKGRP
jgi:hypothetical protein